ncbi:MAG: hypothetical protein JSV19_10515 [Phycisphaerales bacterium]|nr:MAG: hypothetical protein JSV19_10515 [Phycisphaerales bacterium]
MGKTRTTAALTDRCRELVQAHLWLVELHLRRKVPGLSRSGGTRSWDDLYQEGCLGLIEAVNRFDPGRGIPFVAFALPRIHTAVSRALWSDRSLVQVPRRAQRAADDLGGVRAAPRTVPLEHEPAGTAAATDCSERAAGDEPGPETVGARLRAKYEQAVGAAVEHESQVRTRRGDRRLLLERLASDRLLVPGEGHRVSLRRIARDTGSSIARVVQCEQRLRERIAHMLSQDLVVRRLREEARTNLLGMDTPIDDALHFELCELAERRFASAFLRIPARRRGEMVTRLVESCGRSVGDFVRVLYLSLPREQQDVLLSETCALAG